MATWTLQDAKAQFSEVVRACEQEPQLITKRGRDAAVVISTQLWNRLSQRPSVKEVLLGAPKLDSHEHREFTAAMCRTSLARALPNFEE